MSRQSSSYYQDTGSCPVLTLLPFTTAPPSSKGKNRGDPSENEKDAKGNTNSGAVSFSYMAAAELALQHFNARNAAIVPELEALAVSCPASSVQLPSQMVRDNAGSDGIRDILDLMDYYQNMTNGREQYPCAVVGPDTNRNAFVLQGLTGAIQVPQIAYFPKSGPSAVLRRPSVLTVNIDLYDYARQVVKYFTRNDRTHLVASTGHRVNSVDFGAKFLRACEKEQERGFTMDCREQSSDSSFDENIQNTGIRTILIDLDATADLVVRAQQLDSLGMLNGEYLYVLSTPTFPQDLLLDIIGPQKPGSPLDKLLVGSLLIETMEYYEINKDQDKFLQAWKQQDATFVERLNHMVPMPTSNRDPEARIQGAHDYFQTTLPSRGSSFLYDAVMSIGMGACQLAAASASLEDGPPSSENDEMPLMEAILSGTFHGASGLVALTDKFGDKKRVRETIPLGAYNIRANPAEDVDTGLRTYDKVLTSFWSAQAREWQDIQGVPFLYSDGSEVPPKEFVVAESNYLFPWVRTFGLTLVGIAWFVAIAGGVLMWALRNDAAVRKSQPFFQCLLCIGSAIMATAIFTLSQDEGAGWSSDQLDIACASTPWFFFVGQMVAFSALFSKLWRLDRVLQFRRQQVLVTDVLWPLMILGTLSLVVLVVWTVHDPWTWNREFIASNPPETYGECQNDNFWAYFGPLMCLLIAAEAVTVFFAIKTSDVPTDLRECRSILFAMFIQLQSWIIGLLILAVLGTSSANATYLGRVFLIWMFAVSSVVIVVWPRVVEAIRFRVSPAQSRSGRASRVRISGMEESQAKGGLRSTISTLDKGQSHSLEMPEQPFGLQSGSLSVTLPEQHPSDPQSSPLPEVQLDQQS